MRLAVRLAVPLLLAWPLAATAQADESAGNNKMAEIIAFIRVASEACPKVSEVWVFEALALYMKIKPIPSEAAIQAKVAYVTDLRGKIGWVKWCHLYAVELEAAHVIAEEGLP